ncbi:TetR family transcriptional regulator [Croceicoccus estronivorus]|uniref:TetR/AcrR family transcriptional regulator n=1 Tax=Croceicoccus estronivorus TaxID=1172626 RepID=UPI00082C0653|nr:helix-turn-helix domain-containing protein [Croceicoccus estronivorus]OCC24147.1 TetR family transcriptional regulator [Croceicoccus estronivorus]
MAGQKGTVLRIRPRGRPAVLSAEAIVEKAVGMLDAHPTAELSMAAIARELGVSAPALYRYFPDWTALLNAMSAEVFRDFPEIPEDLSWGDQLLFWQKQVVSLYHRHRGVMMLMGWDGQLAGPWLRVQMPVLLVLKYMGFREQALVETSAWFLAGTLGLIRTYLPADMEDVASSNQLDLDNGIGYLTEEQRQMLDEQRPWITSGNTERILETGFRALVEGVIQEQRRIGAAD